MNETNTERLKIEAAGGDAGAREELTRSLDRQGDPKALRARARCLLGREDVDWCLEVRRFGVWGAVDLLEEPVKARDKRLRESIGGPAPAYHLAIDVNCYRRLSLPFITPLIWNDDRVRKFAALCATTAITRTHAIIAAMACACIPAQREHLQTVSDHLRAAEVQLSVLADLGPFLGWPRNAEELLGYAAERINDHLIDIDDMSGDDTFAPDITSSARWSVASAGACLYDRRFGGSRALVAARRAARFARRAHPLPEVVEAEQRAIMLALLLEEE